MSVVKRPNRDKPLLHLPKPNPILLSSTWERGVIFTPHQKRSPMEFPDCAAFFLYIEGGLRVTLVAEPFQCYEGMMTTRWRAKESISRFVIEE